jgi:hypothetical protein
MKIKNIKAMRNYLYENSGFSKRTVNNVISALGFSLNGSGDIVKDLSGEFENCAEHGANVGFGGFIYYSDTIAFYKANRQDIVDHMENFAAELGTDIISMVQGFGVFRNSEKPTSSEVGKALWGNVSSHNDLFTLYNVFAWYALEEVSRTWYRYLEDNPAVWEKMSA